MAWHKRAARLAAGAVLALSAAGFSVSAAQAQSPTYGVGRAPTAAEERAWDIAISPEGKELPAGHGTAKEGEALYKSKGCAGCHGASGSGGRAPMLIKPADDAPKSTAACLSPCINESNVMALHAPYATIMWDYINRGMPLFKEGSLTPDEVYSITAYLLYKNGVLKSDSETLTEKTLPKLPMPNKDGAAMPHEWHKGTKPLENYP